jgi:hypothetical protein
MEQADACGERNWEGRVLPDEDGCTRVSAWVPDARQAGTRIQDGRHGPRCMPSGEKTGTQTGGVAVRATGSFNIQTQEIILQGIGAKHFALMPHPSVATATAISIGAVLPCRPQGTGVPRWRSDDWI